eukprot:Amastigsp_a845624_47.p2 type:complete len:181 gc:universal Amastigsp_a845624_47:221-763(+)
MENCTMVFMRCSDSGVQLCSGEFSSMAWNSVQGTLNFVSDERRSSRSTMRRKVPELKMTEHVTSHLVSQLSRSFVTRTMSCRTPPGSVAAITACFVNRTRAVGREKRPYTRPVTTANSKTWHKDSTARSTSMYVVAGVPAPEPARRLMFSNKSEENFDDVPWSPCESSAWRPTNKSAITM